MNKSILAFVLSSFLISGSIVFHGVQSNSAPETNQDKQERVITGDSIKQVEIEFNKIESKEDKLMIHKLFAGSAEYLMNAKSLTSTSQFDPILNRVQTSYGWNRETYPEFTDAVSKYLVEMDYVTPKELKTEADRLKFAKIFQGLAGATKYE